MANCSVVGCDRPVYHVSRRLCSAHNARLVRNGCVRPEEPLGPRKYKSRTNWQWLLDHRDHAGTECLIWPYGKFSNGYGQVCVSRVNKVASREMCTLAHGDAPSPSHEAAHSCGNGHLGCVNPTHLRWATRIENETDKQVHRRIRGHRAVIKIEGGHPPICAEPKGRR